MKVKDVRHLPLFEAFSADKDEEDVDSVSNLPYFDLISQFSLFDPSKQFTSLNEKQGKGCAFCWTQIERALGTCAYLGTDLVAKIFIAQCLWCKTKSELQAILDFQTCTWKNQEHPFLTKYLKLYFPIRTDEAGKIDTLTRLEHCWSDPEIHPSPINTATAAECGNLKTLVQLRTNGFPWDADICSRAALNGHLTCLAYAHENGCPWNVDTCSWAALNGQLPCLIYAHENGCPWDSDTCYGAATYGHLPCLMYAHENEGPWNADTCAGSAENGHLFCLTYARKHGCPKV